MKHVGRCFIQLLTLSQVIFTDPVDCGFGCVSRRRAFTIFVRRDCGRFVGQAQELYDKLCKQLVGKQIEISDLIWADQQAVDAELEQIRSSRTRFSKVSPSSSVNGRTRTARSTKWPWTRKASPWKNKTSVLGRTLNTCGRQLTKAHCLLSQPLIKSYGFENISAP